MMLFHLIASFICVKYTAGRISDEDKTHPYVYFLGENNEHLLKKHENNEKLLY